MGATAFTHDGRTLATGGEGGIAVWDIATWQRERTLGSDAMRRGRRVRPAAGFVERPGGLAPSPDGELVAAISGDPFFGTDRSCPSTTWTADQTASTSTSAGGSASCTGRPTGSGSRSPAATATTSPSSDRRPHRPRGVHAPVPGPVRRLGPFTADDDRLVVAHSEAGPYVPGSGRVEVWDWRRDDSSTPSTSTPGRGAAPDRAPRGDRSPRRRRRQTSRDLEPRDRPAGRRARWPQRPRQRARVQRRQSTLATANGDGSIRVWDATTGEQQLELRGHAGLVTTCRSAPTADGWRRTAPKASRLGPRPRRARRDRPAASHPKAHRRRVPALPSPQRVRPTLSGAVETLRHPPAPVPGA